MKILYVEDEPGVASFVQKGLQSEGYQIDVAFDGMLGWNMFNREEYSLVLLDLNLPKINGFDLCKEIKAANPAQPVMLLTALDNIADKEMGYQAGADDYLVKPFEFRELILRIKALLRRSGLTAYAGRVIQVDDLVLDTGSKTVSRAGVLINLTSREYSLLEYLMINAGKVVSRVDIAQKVWEIHFDTNTNVIDVFINYLRKKIDVGHTKKLLHTVVGMGYMLRK